MLRISQGVPQGPPPPLAGMLAACRVSEGVRVLDPIGGERSWAGEGELWVHLDVGWDEGRLAGLEEPAIFFGPGVDGRHDELIAPPGSSIRPGGLELLCDDLATLPITTWAGFDLPRGSPVRMLAGSGDSPRPVAQVMREVVYLVETHATGLLLFDDADLAAWPGWLEAFEAEARHLPWSLSWQGAISGTRTSWETGPLS